MIVHEIPVVGSTEHSNLQPKTKEIHVRFQFLSDDYDALNSSPKALSTKGTVKGTVTT